MNVRPVEPLVSIVVPAHNEADNLGELHAQLGATLADEPGRFELIVVDDGSRDATVEVCCSLPDNGLAVRVVSFSRNFGHQTAITAGFDVSTGDAVVVLDADLQHPPSAIPAMLAEWRDGADVVYGVRSTNDAEPAFKRLSASAFYMILDKLTDIEVPHNAADFRLLDRTVVDALVTMREDDRYLRGMIAWLGFQQREVQFDRPPRFSGSSKYSTRRMIGLAKAGLIGFSNAPLRFATNLGFVFAALALIAGIFAIGQRVAGAHLVPGWASILVLVSLIGGIQLIVLGIIGEYLGRVHAQARARPLYVVKETHGFTEPVTRRSFAVLPTERRQAAEHDGGHEIV